MAALTDNPKQQAPNVEDWLHEVKNFTEHARKCVVKNVTQLRRYLRIRYQDPAWLGSAANDMPPRKFDPQCLQHAQENGNAKKRCEHQDNCAS